MNSKQAATVAILILTIVLLGGCLGARGKTCPVVVSQKEGIVIDRIEPSYYTVPVGDKISIYMDVQNRGNAPATDVSATLWAYSGFCVHNDNGICVRGEEEEKFEKIYAGTLEPPRLDICSEGDVYTFTWALGAGCDPVRTILAVHLDFNYTSYGYAKIPMASREEYERTQGELKAKGENFPSAGPMQIKMESVQLEPVLIGSGTDDFSIRILFNNLGSGLVGPKGVGELGEVVLSLSGPCKFTKRNLEFKNVATGAILKDEDRTLVWHDDLVVLKSGKQEAIKFAYLTYPCIEEKCTEKELAGFVEDVCRIEASAKYHYMNVESPSKKMGVYGSPDQIQACRALE